MIMKIQVIEDSEGNPTGVFIPIKEWKGIKKKLNDLTSFEFHEPTREEILLNIQAGRKEIELFKKGKLKTTPAKDFLNVL
jgi:hypothetical protein